MAPKIFITGGTGFVGGTVLQHLVSSHPEYEITALARTSSSASSITTAFPSVKIVLGDLDSASVLTSASQAADIVVHTANCDHLASAHSIVSGLNAGSEKFLIHTSGTGILPDLSIPPSQFGDAPSAAERYSDIKDVLKLTSWPRETHAHREVDEIVLAAASEGLKTAIVCPPMIYGKGSGPGNTKSIQAPWLAAATIKRGKGFCVNDGQNVWNQVHVQDLARVYVSLVESAVAGGKGADWGMQAYYFAENGEIKWKDVAERIAGIAEKHGWIKTADVEGLSVDKAKEINAWATVIWGSNSIGKAERARELLGWKPERESIWETLEETVEIEAKALGKK